LLRPLPANLLTCLQYVPTCVALSTVSTRLGSVLRSSSSDATQHTKYKVRYR
jgi:hypothetical protein